MPIHVGNLSEDDMCILKYVLDKDLYICALSAEDIIQKFFTYRFYMLFVRTTLEDIREVHDLMIEKNL